MLDKITNTARRFEDQPMIRWKHWTITVIVIGIAYFVGVIVTAKAPEKVQQSLTAFVGGLVGFGVVFGGLAKAIFDNLEKLSSTRAQRIDQLEEDMAQERIDRLEQINALENQHRQEMQLMESRHKQEMSNLTAKFEAKLSAYNEMQEKNEALQGALVALGKA